MILLIYDLPCLNKRKICCWYPGNCQFDKILPFLWQNIFHLLDFFYYLNLKWIQNRGRWDQLALTCLLKLVQYEFKSKIKCRFPFIFSMFFLNSKLYSEMVQKTSHNNNSDLFHLVDRERWKESERKTCSMKTQLTSSHF